MSFGEMPLSSTRSRQIRIGGALRWTAPTFSGGYAISGRIDSVALGIMKLVLKGEVVAGTVRTPRRTYRIQSAGGGMHAIS